MSTGRAVVEQPVPAMAGSLNLTTNEADCPGERVTSVVATSSRSAGRWMIAPLESSTDTPGKPRMRQVEPPALRRVRISNPPPAVPWTSPCPRRKSDVRQAWDSVGGWLLPGGATADEDVRPWVALGTGRSVVETDDPTGGSVVGGGDPDRAS
jgi:hypothetical protein